MFRDAPVLGQRVGRKSQQQRGRSSHAAQNFVIACGLVPLHDLFRREPQLCGNDLAKLFLGAVFTAPEPLRRKVGGQIIPPGGRQCPGKRSLLVSVQQHRHDPVRRVAVQKGLDLPIDPRRSGRFLCAEHDQKVGLMQPPLQLLLQAGNAGQFVFVQKDPCEGFFCLLQAVGRAVAFQLCLKLPCKGNAFGGVAVADKGIIARMLFCLQGRQKRFQCRLHCRQIGKMLRAGVGGTQQKPAQLRPALRCIRQPFQLAVVIFPGQQPWRLPLGRPAEQKPAQNLCRGSRFITGSSRSLRSQQQDPGILLRADALQQNVRSGRHGQRAPGIALLLHKTQDLQQDRAAEQGVKAVAGSAAVQSCNGIKPSARSLRQRLAQNAAGTVVQIDQGSCGGRCARIGSHNGVLSKTKRPTCSN